ncbi:crotonase/enoyl-CoA hydratase family protein [Kordiimonas marina]|uniref:crotonase/enoyl-CoA hydratase family protein n=1 Tax=Kordiimonas marina TaxID=2872312 RepID=UPI001FF52CEB|nr:crotonase/enoyl-CoA hydratase family protein [Kordiimonas marina]MCJ9428324.1 crotonase/enoyl-CoA hydratase family protein [Kordiimonas marina]
MTKTYETLTLTVKDAVAHVSLSRPDQLNAMNRAMFREIGEVFRHLDTQSDIRAVVLSGEGKHFTAGLDLKESGESLFTPGDADPARVREKLRRHILWLQDCFTAIEQCRAPVIAAIHGACLGGGIDLISACDMRVASEDCWFAIQEINVAIVADVGTLQRAPYLLPNGILRELALTGRKFTVQEADKYGFVNAVAPDRGEAIEAAFALAETIASKSPLAVAGTKAVLNHSRDHSVADGLDYVATWNSGMLLGEDLMKAATAALTRQTVTFAPLMESDD